MEPFALVLGIAQDAGVPQAGCERPCCAPAWRDPRRRRLPACLGLVDGDTSWLIDATPAVGEQLHRLHEAAPSAPLGGVLLTHAHLGHVSGLLHLGREAAGVRALPVWAMPRLYAFLHEAAPWELLVRAGHVTPRRLLAGVPVRLGRLEVTPVLVPHRDEYSETVGFVVRGARARLLWLPDIDGWDAWRRPLADAVAEVDHAFVDGTFWSAAEVDRDPGDIPHPAVPDTLHRLAHAPPAVRARVRLVHLNHTNPCLWPHTPERAVVEAAGVAVAEEGERIPL